MNLQQAIEALLDDKKVKYFCFEVSLKNNTITYGDGSSCSLEDWLRAVKSYSGPFTIVNKVLCKDIPVGSVFKMVNKHGEAYGGTYLKISQNKIVADTYYIQAGNYDNWAVKVVGAVKW